MRSQEHSVMIVEDSDVDFDILRTVLSGIDQQLRIVRVKSGEEALAKLNRESSNGTALPGLIVMDLNLPGMNGAEVITEMRQNLAQKSVPVVILSTSTNPGDVNACYDAGCNAYLAKPIDFDEFESMISSLVEFWFFRAKLPDHTRRKIRLEI